VVADPRATTAASDPSAAGGRHSWERVPEAVVRVQVARGPARNDGSSRGSRPVRDRPGRLPRALYKIDPAGGRIREAQLLSRRPLTTYDTETRETISSLTAEIDADAATEVWDAALAAAWHGPAVWIHGDVTGANLLVVDGA